MSIKIEELKCCIDVILRLENKLNAVKERQKIEPIEIESLQYDVDLLRKWAGIEHLHKRKIDSFFEENSDDDIVKLIEDKFGKDVLEDCDDCGEI